MVSSKQTPKGRLEYVPPNRRTRDDVDRRELDVDDDQTDRDARVPSHGKALTIDHILRVYQDFKRASHSDQKLNLPEFMGESNGDTLMDWIIQDESVSEYKKYKHPKRELLTKTKLGKVLCKGGAVSIYPKSEQESRGLLGDVR